MGHQAMLHVYLILDTVLHRHPTKQMPVVK